MAPRPSRLPALLILALAPWAAAQDPELDAFRRNVERLVERHPVLPRLGLESSWEDDRRAFLVQVPGTAPPGFREQAIGRELDRASSIEERFASRLAGPLQLVPRPGAPRMVVVLLADGARFAEFYQAAYGVEAGGREAWYDLSNRFLLVADEDPPRPAGERRLRVDHERALQVLHAHSSSALALPGRYWLQQGLAAWLAGRTEPELAGAEGTSWSLHRLAEALADPGRHGQLVPLSELLAATSYWNVDELARARATAAGGQAPTAWDSHALFVDQAAVLVHYLHGVADEELRAALTGHLALAFAGAIGRAEDPLGLLLEREGPAVESGLWVWVWREHARGCPLAGCRGLEDEDALEAFLASRPDLVPRSGARLAPSAFAARDLVDELRRSAGGTLALALVHLRRGAVGEARAVLLGAVEGPDRALAGDRRLLRELARVEAWREERDRFLEHLVSSGEVLRLERPELRARVLAVEEGRLVLEDEDVPSLELEELDPLSLARAMVARRTRFEAGWAAAYPLVVAGHEDAERALRGEDVQLRMLAADLERDYPRRAPDVLVCERVLELATGRGELLEHVRVLVSSQDASTLVESLVPGLRLLAERELELREEDPAQRARRLGELGLE